MMTGINRADVNLGGRRGAALTEYVIVGLLVSLFSITLVMLFGDNVRALFGSTDNSLAGVDSSPATRVSDGPLHASLAGLGAAEQSGTDMDKAAASAKRRTALKAALKNGEKFGDWEMPVNVHPEVAGNLYMVGMKPIHFSLSVGAAVDIKAKFNEAKRLAGENGVVFSGDSSSGTFSGVVAGSYRVSGSTIWVTVTRKPTLASRNFIQSRLTEFLR